MKTKISILIFLYGIIVSPIWGQSKVLETRVVTPFNSINTNGYFEIIYIKSDVCTVKIEADQGVGRHVVTKETKGVLLIENEFSNLTEKAIIYLTAPTLNDISINGATSFSGDQIENTGDIRLNAFGSAAFNVTKINADTVIFKSSGSAEIDINHLSAKMCEINIAGSSVMKMEVETETIHIISRGSADVNLKGTTNHISIDNKGNSDINLKKLSYETIEE